MYKLIDKINGYVHQMSEDHIKEYIQESLGIDNVGNMDIEEMQEILHAHNYSLERNN